MRTGIFGGTFDPVHVGHLILAERCREDARLDEVWFLPSYRPPHKLDRPVTRFEQRCDMLGLATVGQPRFRVESIEKELPPPSYTANTLAALRARHPERTFHLIVGADTLADLPTWYEPRRVAELAELVVVPRPGAPDLSDRQLDHVRQVLAPQPLRVTAVECPLMAIASRDIRDRVTAGRSVRYLVPRAVEEYVREKRLYQSQ